MPYSTQDLLAAHKAAMVVLGGTIDVFQYFGFDLSELRAKAGTRAEVISGLISKATKTATTASLGRYEAECSWLYGFLAGMYLRSNAPTTATQERDADEQAPNIDLPPDFARELGALGLAPNATADAAASVAQDIAQLLDRPDDVGAFVTLWTDGLVTALSRLSGSILEIAFQSDDFQKVDLTSVNVKVAVAPVIIREATGVFRGLGTAFCISLLMSGKAIYVTAAHVVSEFAPTKVEGQKFAVVRPLGGREPFLVVPRSLRKPDDAYALQAIRIESVWVVVHNDIAVITVDLSDFEFAPADALVFGLGLDPPVIGDECCAIGYSSMETYRAVDDPNTVTWQGPLHASQATIEAIHPSGRDRAMLTFPCFRTSAFYAPGMSGGPIVSSDGRVLGVVSASFERGGGTAYGALMGSILESELRLPTENGEMEDFDFPSLIADKVVKTDNTSIVLNRDTDGLSLSWPDHR